jgi:hypothetical protein
MTFSMKSLGQKSLAASLLLAVVSLFSGPVQAQDAPANPPQNLVALGSPKAEVQFTPDFKVGNVKEKRWQPKQWLEIEIPFKAAPPPGKQDVKFYDTLTFKFYVFLEPADKDKVKVLTLEVNHINVPVGEDLASAVYLSPSTVLNLTGDSRPNPRLIKQIGVEVLNGGQMVGGYQAPWWKSPKAPAQVQGVLLNKSQTPFAVLWGDYHPDIQGANK